jgi:frataxin-like iron-binding protein CyaY
MLSHFGHFQSRLISLNHQRARLKLMASLPVAVRLAACAGMRRCVSVQSLVCRVRAAALSTRAERTAAAAAAASPAAFRAAVGQLFSRVVNGLTAVAEANAGFAVEHTEEAVRIVTGDGATYQLRAETPALRVVLSAPATSFSGSGEQRYLWDAARGEWVDEKDRHLLFDKLTRDLVAAVKGYPTW